MIKISFIGNSESPKTLLELFKKMTPGRSGCWGMIQGIDNHESADYHVVIDRLSKEYGVITKEWIINICSNGKEILEKLLFYKVIRELSDTEVMLNYGLSIKKEIVKIISGDNFEKIWSQLTQSDHPFIIDESKCIFLGAHPKSISGAYVNMDSLKCFKKYDCEKIFGFGEVWLMYDYDFLSSFQRPKKTKLLCSIVSNVDSYYNHKARLAWLKRFTDSKPNEYNLYGRIVPFTDTMKYYYRGTLGSNSSLGNAEKTNNNHMIGKERILSEHKYIIEFDNDCPDGHYFSERVFDDLLMWCMPIYWGGGNLHKYIPQESFRYLNINGDGEDVFNIIKEDSFNKYLDAIAEARDILLNKLQIWPYVHHAIFGTYK